MNHLTFLYERRLSKTSSVSVDELKASLDEEKRKLAEMAEKLAASKKLEEEALQSNIRLSETKKKLKAQLNEAAERINAFDEEMSSNKAMWEKCRDGQVKSARSCAYENCARLYQTRLDQVQKYLKESDDAQPAYLLYVQALGVYNTLKKYKEDGILVVPDDILADLEAARDEKEAESKAADASVEELELDTFDARSVLIKAGKIEEDVVMPLVAALPVEDDVEVGCTDVVVHSEDLPPERSEEQTADAEMGRSAEVDVPAGDDSTRPETPGHGISLLEE